MAARQRTVGLGPSSYQQGAPSGSSGPLSFASSGGGTPEGRALVILVIVELLVTGWLRVIFKGVHGG
jgi:hypothetical protein